MTQDEIWDWQCRLHIYSCYLYEIEDKPVLSDTLYDQHCIMLLRHYDKLPAWFTDRISRTQLETASGSGITFSPHDIDGAHEWVRTAQGWREHYGLPRT